MANLAAETKDLGFHLEQVQDFTPTPMTVAEVIYYTGVHPYTLQPIKTAKTREEKLAQNRFFFWYKPEFRTWIRSRLHKLNRPDLADRLLSSPKKKEQDSMPVGDMKKKKKKNNYF